MSADQLRKDTLQMSSSSKSCRYGVSEAAPKEQRFNSLLGDSLDDRCPRLKTVLALVQNVMMSRYAMESA